MLGLSISMTRAQSDENRKVTLAFDQLVVAMIKADAGALDAVVSDALDYGHSSGVFQDKAGFIQEVVSKNPLVYQSIDRENETVTVSGSTAVMRSMLTIRGLNPAGENVVIRLGTMMVWKKEKKQWKLYARQGFRIPT